MSPEDCRWLKLKDRYIKENVWNCLILVGSYLH
jgi:hypothetical protein